MTEKPEPLAPPPKFGPPGKLQLISSPDPKMCFAVGEAGGLWLCALTSSGKWEWQEIWMPVVITPYDEEAK